VNEWLLLLLVFGFVTALGLTLGSLFGGGAGRRLRTRLDALSDSADAEQATSAIRARYLRQLSPAERALEELPGMVQVGHMTEQAGWTVPAWRFAAITLGLAATGVVLGGLLARSPMFALIAGAGLGLLPLLKLRMDRGKRLEQFDTQLPDALDLMSRSLRAGNPLLESFKFVSEEMKPPISTEFGRAWSNINYGVSLKASLEDFLGRTPSVSLRSLATAILVQRETGGNLAEILDKITHVLRARAKFQRRLRTLTAEGRMSGWVLGGLPFALAGVISATSPNYLPMLVNEPSGRKLIAYAMVLMAVGLFWISRVVKIRV
jgi:tight adherence protein B